MATTKKSTPRPRVAAAWISSTFFADMSSWVRSLLSDSAWAALEKPLKPRVTDDATIFHIRRMPMRPEIAMAPIPMGLTKAPKIAVAFMSAIW